MDTFQALADPTRRHIIELLAEYKQLTATQISKEFTMSPPAISQHLKILKEAKVVDMEKKAQQRIYTINPASIDTLSHWIEDLKKMWNERYDKLDKLLKKERYKSRKGK